MAKLSVHHHLLSSFSRSADVIDVTDGSRVFAGRHGEWPKRSVGRPTGRSVGRLFSGLANWFPAARLDYANRICVLAFD